MDDAVGEDPAAAKRGARSRRTRLRPELEHALAAGGGRAIVLVEGASDRAAVRALAERHGRDLEAEGVAVIPIGGAGAIGRVLALLRARRPALRLAGLCDAGEAGDFRRALERVGFGSELTRDGMEALGFFVCVQDLEDELIRCLGVASVQQVLAAQHELGSFRIFQRQPAQQGRPTDQQLRRFIGTRAGRKIRYGRLLVEALELTSVPRPLDGVLAHVAGAP